jgi:hypothetical protein
MNQASGRTRFGFYGGVARPGTWQGRALDVTARD